MLLSTPTTTRARVSKKVTSSEPMSPLDPVTSTFMVVAPPRVVLTVDLKVESDGPIDRPRAPKVLNTGCFAKHAAGTSPPSSALDGPRRQPLHHVALEDDGQEDGRERRQKAGGGDHGVVDVGLAHHPRDDRRQGRAGRLR